MTACHTSVIPILSINSAVTYNTIETWTDQILQISFDDKCEVNVSNSSGADLEVGDSIRPLHHLKDSLLFDIKLGIVLKTSKGINNVENTVLTVYIIIRKICYNVFNLFISNKWPLCIN